MQVIKEYSGITVTFDSEESSNQKNLIYLLQFPNGKVYIGQTTMELKQRIKHHCYKSSGCAKLKHGIQKYKEFKVSVLSSNLTLEQMNLFEQMFIEGYNSNGSDGYNLEGGGLNHTVSEETRAKLSIAAKNMSQATKDKISKTLTGRKLSDERKNKQSIISKNMSQATKDKIGLASKGHVMTDSNKAKLKERNLKIQVSIKSIPDNIIFESISQATRHYGFCNRSNLKRYLDNGKIHSTSGQTFISIKEPSVQGNANT